jgi:hypothetical protein
MSSGAKYRANPDTRSVVISKRVSWFFVAFGVWSWIIWPTFLRNIWKDDRSFGPGPDGGPTGFLLVHAVLTIASLAFGTAIGVLGARGLTRSRADVRERSPAQR